MKTRVIGLAMVSSLAVLLASSCDVATPTAPRAASERSALLGLPILPHRLSCPTNDTQTTTSEIGPLGGVISVGGTNISVPAGALLETVTMTVTVPAGQYMEVDISVAGVDHFLFQSPATVTVDYSRCSNVNLWTPLFTAWWANTDTKELLEPMPSVDLRALRTVTFTTPHLSGFILAN
jgi:hypothetical protein